MRGWSHKRGFRPSDYTEPLPILDIHVTLGLESGLAASDSGSAAGSVDFGKFTEALRTLIFPFVKVVMMLTSLSQEKSDKCSGQLLAGPQGLQKAGMINAHESMEYTP